MLWQVPKIWQDGEVWIIGGGPSIFKQFEIPEEVVQKVINKEASPEIYSPYMSSIHNKHVIGVNVAFKIGQWIDMVFFGDSSFLLRYEKGLAEFPGLVISCHPRVDRYGWIKHTARDNNKRYGLTNNPKKVCWNGNSGGAAINLAVHTGVKRIVLLGFDMVLDETKKQHWHSEYPQRVGKKNRPVPLPFNRHLKGFPQIAKDARMMGIEILNCSGISAIKDFKRVNLKDLV
jgi:hypothetical protein